MGALFVMLIVLVPLGLYSWWLERKPRTVIHRVCAWCRKDLGTVDGRGVSGVSHGMCPACADGFRAQIRASRPEEVTT